MNLTKNDVEWVVNDIAELGVKIGNQFFFLYKGRSYQGGNRWRRVGKREFGECCHPWQAIERKEYGGVITDPRRPVGLPDTYVGYHGEPAEEWGELPAGDEGPAEIQTKPCTVADAIDSGKPFSLPELPGWFITVGDRFYMCGHAGRPQTGGRDVVFKTGELARRDWKIKE